MQGDKISSEDIDVLQQDKGREMYTKMRFRWGGVVEGKVAHTSQQRYLH